MGSKTYPYEFHLTVKHEPSRLTAFTKACDDLGVKPILLDLDMETELLDLMTSSTMSFGCDADAMAECKRVRDGLIARGFEVIREKIETAPFHPDAPSKDSDIMPEGSYWESHVKLLCPNDRIDELRGICTQLGGYLSRNIYQRAKTTHSFIFATLRAYEGTASEFRTELSLFLEGLKRHNQFHEEVVITEFIIYDSNIAHDRKWESLYTR